MNIYRIYKDFTSNSSNKDKSNNTSSNNNLNKEKVKEKTKEKEKEKKKDKENNILNHISFNISKKQQNSSGNNKMKMITNKSSSCDSLLPGSFNNVTNMKKLGSGTNNGKLSCNIRLPEIIVSPPSPSPFPQVSTSQESLCGSKHQLNKSQMCTTIGVNNMPILDLNDIPAVCEHEYDDDDILILESVFYSRNNFIRPIESIYMNQVDIKDKNEENGEEDDDNDDDEMIDVISFNTNDNAIVDLMSDTNKNSLKSTTTPTTTPNQFSQSNYDSCQPMDIDENNQSQEKTLNKKKRLVFTKCPQSLVDDMEQSRCCWLTSTLQVVCNIPGVETDFPR